MFDNKYSVRLSNLKIYFSPVPTVVGTTAPPPQAVEDSELNKKKAESSLNINENEPTTNITVYIFFYIKNYISSNIF